MKPFIRYKGLTESDFLPMMHGKPYSDLVKFVEDKVGKIVDDGISSRKLKISMKIISMTKAALKGTTESTAFQTTIDNAKKLTEQKRYYISDYGFSNMIDYVNCKTDKLSPGENYHKHELENIIAWWKNKAANRYDTLKSEGRLRTELEVWTNNKNIDIIR
jgi:AAA+ ATPase superfamily predicted ATPase